MDAELEPSASPTVWDNAPAASSSPGRDVAIQPIELPGRTAKRELRRCRRDVGATEG
jgi:hypothetical protein